MIKETKDLLDAQGRKPVDFKRIEYLPEYANATQGDGGFVFYESAIVKESN